MKLNIFFAKNIAILFIILLRLTPFLAAQEEGLRVLVQSSPDVPVAGSPWILTLLVNHAVPEEVSVMAPPFTGTFFLDQVLKGPRLVNPATGQNFSEKNIPQRAGTEPGGAEVPPEQSVFEHWTAMEYRFTLNNSGAALLDSFTVSAPHGSTITAPLAIRVQNAQTAVVQLRPKLTWEDVSAGIKSGTAGEFSLRVNGWDSRLPLPPADYFMPAIPPGLILESTAIPAAEQARGTVLKLRLLPLGIESFALPRRSFSWGNAVFEIPALRIPISPALPSRSTAPESASATNSGADSKTGGAAETPPPLPFPDFDAAIGKYPALQKKFREASEAPYNAAKSLWENGCHAEALAELRRQERDHPAGTLFASIRKEAEENLGLFHTADEKQRKFPFPIFAASLCLALAALALRIKFAGKPKEMPEETPQGKKHPAFSRAAPLAIGGLACLLALSQLALYGLTLAGIPGIFPPDRETAAKRHTAGVLRETSLRRVPDPSGEETARFAEGQPVRLPPDQGKRFSGSQPENGGGRGAWVRVIANDDSGVSGWVPVETIIFY